MSVKVTDNSGAIFRQATSRMSLGLRFLSEDVIRRSTPKTPRREGHLRRDYLIQVLGLKATIAWLKRYAATQEDVRHRRYTTPGTGPHFAANAVRDAVDNAKTPFRRAGLV